MSKPLKFKRPAGFGGCAPRNWIDKELPSCPFCSRSPPEWEMAMEMKFSLNRYHFRCPSCLGQVSIPVSAVDKGSLILGLHALHAATPKTFIIESVGRRDHR